MKLDEFRLKNVTKKLKNKCDLVGNLISQRIAYFHETELKGQII